MARPGHVPGRHRCREEGERRCPCRNQSLPPDLRRPVPPPLPALPRPELTAGWATRVRGVAGAAAFLLTLFGLAYGAVLLAPAGSRVASWWPAAGLAVGVVAGAGRRSRTPLLVAVFGAAAAANYAGGRPAVVAIGLGAANALEVALGSWWLSRGTPDGERPALASLVDLGRLAVAAGLGAVVAASVATAVVWTAQGAPPLSSWRSVAAAHSAAVLVIVPLFLRTPEAPRWRTWEVAGQWALPLAVTAIVFGPGQRLPLAFLVLPPLMWTALRGGVRRTAGQLLVVGAIVALLSAHGGGPFAGARSAVVTGQLVQVLVLTAAITVLTLAVVVSSLEQALRGLAERKWFDDEVLETVGAGVLACNASGQVVLRNQAQRRITMVADDEHPSNEDVAGRIRVLLADGTELEPDRSPLRRALAGEQLTDLAVRIGAVDGQPEDMRHVVVTARRIASADGTVLGAVASFNDVTAERRAQDELRDSAAFHDAVLAASPDLIFVVDPRTGAPVWTSQGLGEMLGHTPEQVVSLGAAAVAALVHPDDAGRLQGANLAAQDLADGEVVQVRYRTRHADGSWRWLSRRVTPFARDSGGAVVQILGVARDVTDTVRVEERLARAALHDPLTGLPNRRLLTDRLVEALARSARSGSTVTVLFCDLDGFKAVNDTGGHAAGDAVLVAAGERIRAALREHDTVARVGGDEFVVVLEGWPSPAMPGDHDEQTAAAHAVAQRLRTALAEPVKVNDRQYRVTVSIGMAQARPGDDADQLLRDADGAMYVAKSAGKDRADVHRLWPAALAPAAG